MPAKICCRDDIVFLDKLLSMIEIKNGWEQNKLHLHLSLKNRCCS